MLPRSNTSYGRFRSIRRENGKRDDWLRLACAASDSDGRRTTKDAYNLFGNSKKKKEKKGTYNRFRDTTRVPATRELQKADVSEAESRATFPKGRCARAC